MNQRLEQLRASGALFGSSGKGKEEKKMGKKAKKTQRDKDAAFQSFTSLLQSAAAAHSPRASPQPGSSNQLLAAEVERLAARQGLAQAPRTPTPSALPASVAASAPTSSSRFFGKEDASPVLAPVEHDRPLVICDSDDELDPAELQYTVDTISGELARVKERQEALQAEMREVLAARARARKDASPQ